MKLYGDEALFYYKKSTAKQTVHLISCNWLPFYRPCSFASQTFIWFAEYPIKAFKLKRKYCYHYTPIFHCTQAKPHRFDAFNAFETTNH